MQFSVVEVPDQSLSLHSQALSTIIAAPRSENSRTCADHGAGNFPSWRSLTNRSRFTPRHPEKRKQLHLCRSWSRQFSVVEVPDQSISLHSQALSSIISAARSENSRTCADHGACNFPSWSPEKRKQPHLCRSWSRQFSVVEVPDQSISLHSQTLSSIIAAKTAAPVQIMEQTIFRRGGPLPIDLALLRGTFQHNSGSEKRKQPHMCRSWSRQFSVVEVPDQSLSLHSHAVSNIISAKTAAPVQIMEQAIFRRGGPRPIDLASPLGTFQHNCGQFSVVEVPDQSLSLHSQALFSIIAGTFQHNCSPEKRKQLHLYRSWRRQFSVVEVPDQSILLHSQALSSIIAAPRSKNSRTCADHGAGNFPSWSPEKRKQPHLCRSWSRQFSVVEVPDQSLLLHSQALSSMIAAPRSENNCTCVDHGAGNFPSWSPEKRKQLHLCRSWSRQFSIVEVPDQSILLHSQALSSIIAALRSENNRTCADHGAGNFPSWSPEKRKQLHMCRSWSRQFSVVEVPYQSISLYSQALSSIITGSRQFSVVEVPDQSLSLHSQALSSINAALRSENSCTCADHGAGNFPSWSPEKQKQPHMCRSWSRQFSVVEVPDQSLSLHSQALSSIIAGPPEKRKQLHLCRSWSRQFSVVEVPDQSISFHSQALSSIFTAPRSENSRTCADHGADNFLSLRSLPNRSRFTPKHFPA
ncbi:unnamed protein product [Closterium sp. Yama58-4]|nr:unnamed protein product [Closterium sp. Yama58-4]